MLTAKLEQQLGRQADQAVHNAKSADHPPDVYDLAMARSAEGRSYARSYRDLLHSFTDAGFVFRTHGEGFSNLSSTGKSIFLRHDVDHKLDIALSMARIEHDLGARSTYYLLHPGDYNQNHNYFGTINRGRISPSASLVRAVRELSEMGHEVGLHNDLVQLSIKTGRSIQDLLTEILDIFCREGIQVAGTASHGSRFAREHGFVNYQIFQECRRHERETKTLVFEGHHAVELYAFPLAQFGLKYEAYSLVRDCTIADTGGRLTIGKTFIEDLDCDFLRDQTDSKARVMMLIHPDWWLDRPMAKPTFQNPHKHPPMAFRRTDGKPLRVAIRGDCCSRRMVAMNPTLFPDGVDVLVNEKCPNRVFIDSLSGISITTEELGQISANRQRNRRVARLQ